MKYLLFYLLTAMTVTSTMAADGNNSIQWLPVFGIKNQTLKMYFNQQSYIRVGDSEGHYGQGDVLLVFEQPTETILNGKKVIARSMVKSIVVNCKTAVAAPIADYYYSVDTPRKDEVALGIIRYNVEASAEQISKKSSLFITFCAPQV